jgi:hypothetical protein
MRMNRNVNVNLLFNDEEDSVENGEAVIDDSDDDNVDEAAFIANDDDDQMVDDDDDADEECDDPHEDSDDDAEYELSQFEFSVRSLMRCAFNVFNYSNVSHLITAMKFHQMLHCERCIKYFGVAQKFSGCRPESNVKDTAKMPWLASNKRQNSPLYFSMCKHCTRRSIFHAVLNTGMLQGIFHQNNAINSIVDYPNKGQCQSANTKRQLLSNTIKKKNK